MAESVGGVRVPCSPLGSGAHAGIPIPRCLQTILSGIIAGVGKQRQGSSVNLVAYWALAVRRAAGSVLCLFLLHWHPLGYAAAACRMSGRGTGGCRHVYHWCCRYEPAAQPGRGDACLASSHPSPTVCAAGPCRLHAGLLGQAGRRGHVQVRLASSPLLSWRRCHAPPCLPGATRVISQRMNPPSAACSGMTLGPFVQTVCYLAIILRLRWGQEAAAARQRAEQAAAAL